MPPLVAAIEKANKTSVADTIVLKAGCTYVLTAGSYNNGSGSNGLPIVTAPLTIHGSGATIMRYPAAPVFRIFQVESDFALDHAIVTNGRTSGDDPPVGSGGAILGVSGSLAIADSVFADNAATVSGGAIQALVPVSLARDTFERNKVTLPMSGDRAVGGGALSVGGDSASTLVIVDSAFTDNATASSYGGALSYGGPSDVTITHSTFTGNQAPGASVGNAFWIGGANSVSVSDSTFTLNGGGGCAINWEGGGLDEKGTLTVTGSTFDRNPNCGLGVLAGGTLSEEPDVRAVVANSTFFDSGLYLMVMWPRAPEMHVTNSTVYGGGVSTWMNNGGEGTVTLRNTIVAGGRCGPQVQNGGGNLAWFAPDCPYDIMGDPKLRPLAWNNGPTQTMALEIDSAALNLGLGTTCAAAIGPSGFGAGGIDQRGVFRPRGMCDAGAYERP